MKIRTGDIGHCRREKLLSKIIRWFTKSDFNHSVIFLDINGTLCVAEAQSKGIHIIEFHQWLKEYKYTFEVSRPLNKKVDSKKFTQRVLSKTQVTKYDLGALLFSQPWYQAIGKWFGPRGKKAQKKMYCSEFVAWCHRIPESYKMSPEDLYQYCKNSTDYIKLKFK